MSNGLYRDLEGRIVLVTCIGPGVYSLEYADRIEVVSEVLR